MKNQIELSDDDDSPGGHEYASILLDPDFPDDPIEQLDPEPSLDETVYSPGLLPGLVHVEPVPTTVQTKPDGQATCPRTTQVPVRRNAQIRKARKPAAHPVRLVSASELKEACEALAPAGSHLLVLELFCGAGKVAKLASDSGFIGIGMDILGGDFAVDLADKDSIRVICDLVRSGRVKAIHGGLPCESFSPARRGKRSVSNPRGYPARLRSRGQLWGLPTSNMTGGDKTCLERGNRCLEGFLAVVRVCLEHGVTVSLEQPANSMMWQIPELLALKRSVMASFGKLDVDYCRFGKDWLRGSTSWSSASRLTKSARLQVALTNPMVDS